MCFQAEEDGGDAAEGGEGAESPLTQNERGIYVTLVTCSVLCSHQCYIYVCYNNYSDVLLVYLQEREEHQKQLEVFRRELGDLKMVKTMLNIVLNFIHVYNNIMYEQFIFIFNFMLHISIFL